MNAAGPWVAQFIGENLQQRSPYGIRLIQGSHIIVPRLYEGEQAYIMQNEDRRIVFAIPYLDRYTMIGTTDREYHGDPAQVSITEQEIAYVLGVANTHFRKQLEPRDIVHTFAGVRPLCDDESDNPSAVTRDYTLSLVAEEKQAPLLSVFGGKLTTYRKLAESAMAQLKPFFPAWATAGRPMPRCPAAKTWARPKHWPRHWSPMCKGWSCPWPNDGPRCTAIASGGCSATPVPRCPG